MALRFGYLLAGLPLGIASLALVGVCEASEKSSAVSAAQSFYNQGMRAQKHGDLDEAVNLFERAVEADPTYPYTLQALGISYHQLFSDDATYFDDAETVYRAFIQVLDDDAGETWTASWLQCGRNDLGLLYLEAGAYQAAITTMLEAIEHCPDLLSDGNAVNALGMGYYYLGNYEAAAKYFYRAVEVEPALDVAHYNLWSVMSRLFLFNYVRNLTTNRLDPVTALYQVQQLRRIAPHYIGAKILEGRIFMEARRLDEAYALFSDIVATEENIPEAVDLRIEMARILMVKGETEAAKEQLVHAMSSLTDADMQRRATVSSLLIKLLRKPANVTVAKAIESGPAEPNPEELRPVSGGHAIFNCDDCHIEDKALDELSTCGGCHPTFINLHPVNFIPKRDLPGEFILGDDGKMVCATCHQLHGGSEGSSYLRFTEQSGKHSRDEFCSQCHGANLSRQNPHRRDIGTSRCVFCHATQRDVSVSRGKTVEICNFCHGVLAKNHPQTLYFFDEENPIVDIDKAVWTCVTCHLPHGTSDTVNFLRQKVVSAIERVRRRDPHEPIKSTCNNCHRVDDSEVIRSSPEHSLRYQGDVGMLCISCHIIDKGHHPMGVLLPDDQPDFVSGASDLGLNREKRIDCYTCHINECMDNSYRMKLRVSEGGAIRNELCWKCHNKKNYMKRSPHIDDSRYCLYCHETQPSEDVPSTGNDVPENVCTHCHEVSPHPTGEHLVQPSRSVVIPEDFPLGGEGQILCSTCHEPHQVEAVSEAPLNPRRLRGDYEKFCLMCHQEL